MKAFVIAAVLSALAAPAHADDVQALSLKDAEQRAVQNHPQVRASHYAALASGETVREAKSAYFPTVFGSVTGAGAPDGTRIAAGGLNNPTILDRFAAGFTVSQLLTDFGRTSDLVRSASLRADAQQQSEETSRAVVLLQVDRSYFDALRAQALLKVAQETVEARKLVADQVEALAQGNLKSGLDVSFARVNLSEAQLFLAQAESDVTAAFASLSAALGDPAPTMQYRLAEEPLPSPPPAAVDALIAEAMQQRPDVAAERMNDQAARAFADAERALWMPALSVVGAAGYTPYHQLGLNTGYSALGVNVTIPVANGSLYNARNAAARFEAQAAEQRFQDLQNRVGRDVTVAWLNARTAFQRLDLTNQLLAQASDALELAQARYNLGLSSIVELTQAQLNKTRAEIEQTTARYEYESRSAALRYQVGALK